MTAVLQAEAGDADKVAPIVHESKRMGIEVSPPDVNESFRNFAMIQDTRHETHITRHKEEKKEESAPQARIRFGLSAIKNVGEHVCEVIYRERKEHGRYASAEDFLTRIQDKDLNKKSLESLIQAGALDSFGHDRGVLLANIENLLFFVRQTRERETTKQDSLFAGTAIALDAHVTLKDAPRATMDQKLHWEKELLGLYVSSHPFEYFQTVLANIAVPLAQLAEHARDAWVVVGGIAGGLKKKITKRGEVMLFATIEDVTGSVELLVFPKTYEKTTALWRDGNVLLVVGRTPKEDGDNKVFVERASELNKQNAEQIARELSFGMSVRDYAPQMQEEKTVQISLSKQEMKQSAGALKHLFSEYPGEYQVYVRVGENKIKAQSRIDWNSEVLEKLEAVVGEGKVEVFE
ncbi:MAG: hypothetical protein A3C90_00590 [Candidatus Magasanikbacteria bacterium RIFCSPHIGHO2_02_FULL_51_14]|uniref:Uncharacterized protein n=1 Tax=Candidatus Magasanikbacteria bacterium RIFCSPHIGHO2_02_FULL_51_14 TaxID=1798683 RepID=A0A1F6MHG7_9BACT|nr:MAG: hypothetical protein A3C90_00590 [Candidatus Magasanikbacteria bacterium RIFCSPHIGHO2_02_FULL_51_14]